MHKASFLFRFLDSQCKALLHLYKHFNYMFQKKHPTVLSCPVISRTSWQGLGEEGRGQHYSPCPGCHPLSHLLWFALCSLSATSELTADIYFAYFFFYFAYLISSVSVAFYLQLSPKKSSRCSSTCTAAASPYSHLHPCPVCL